MQKSIQLLPLFEKFIADTYRGKRLKPNGDKIKRQTIDNYRYVYKLLQDFSFDTNYELLLIVLTGKNQREIMRVSAYWKKMSAKLSNYLYINRKCHDNYVGNVFKTLKVLFN